MQEELEIMDENVRKTKTEIVKI